MKRFKNFREKSDDYIDDEWGNVNEDRLKEKKKLQRLKDKRKRKEEAKFSAFE